MVKKMPDRKGTTLVELMIVIAIIGVIFSVGHSILMNITRFTQLSNSRLETQSGAREALSHISKTLRQARASTVVISNQTGQPPLSKISFTAIDGRTLGYYQSGKALYFLNGGFATKLSENLRYIAFHHPRTDDSAIISVSVTYEKGTYEGGTKALQMAIEKVRVMN